MLPVGINVATSGIDAQSCVVTSERSERVGRIIVQKDLFFGNRIILMNRIRKNKVKNFILIL